MAATGQVAQVRKELIGLVLGNATVSAIAFLVFSDSFEQVPPTKVRP
jgi:hypothetical protein